MRAAPCTSGSSGISSASARAEPERLVGQLAAPAVALVEDQVDDREHGREPVGQQVLGRHAERDPGRRDLRFARTRRCAIVASGTRNARAISSVVRPPSVAQRQRDLRLQRERRVAAGEDELEPLVRERRLVHVVLLHGLGELEQLVFAASVRSRRIRSIARLRRS